MIFYLIIFSFVVLSSILLLKSIKLMNLITIIYSLTIIGFGILLLTTNSLPLFFFKNKYLFLDVLGVYEIIICGIVFFFSSVYAKGYVDSLINVKKLDPKNVKFFYFVFNLLLLNLVMVFTSNNLALLWIFAELSTVISAILIVILNTKDNIRAAIKYIFITSTGMLFSFIGLIFLFAACKQGLGIGTLNWDALLHGSKLLPPQLLTFSFILFFVGFAAKSGIVPFNTWLPPAHSKAPSDVSAILSGCILNIGIYAIVRFYALTIASNAVFFISNVILIFGVVTIAVAALSMLVRTNLKKLIAYSSIENMGFILVGIAVGNIFWVFYYVLAHSLAKALLFLSAGIINRQYETVQKDKLHDLFKFQPLATWGLIIGIIAVIGMPFFPLFTAKFFILKDLGNYSLYLLFVVLILLLLVASSFGYYFIALIQNTSNKNLNQFHAPLSMKLPIIFLITMLLILGVFMPGFLTQSLDKIVMGLAG